MSTMHVTDDAPSWLPVYKDATDNHPEQQSLPMVEIFETVEGEGTKAGYPTVFVRVFHCNLRCTWCDTPYSYAPYKPEFKATVEEICERVQGYGWAHVCLTGGEPLIHRHKSQLLIDGIAAIPEVTDIHIETNGAIDIRPFAQLRAKNPELTEKVRFIVDYKLPSSGEWKRMIDDHLSALQPHDELKFVIADEQDFQTAIDVVRNTNIQATVLFSPVWESMPPNELVRKMLQEKLPNIKLSLQLHKVIWDPTMRGV